MPKDLIKLGSETAKGGFRNEDEVIRKFNAWNKDADAKKWLVIMGYKLDEIEKVIARKVTGSYKTDVQVQVKIYLKNVISAENLSIKLVSNPQGFNQIDKRWVDKYIELWSIPAGVAKTLKLFTGEIRPKASRLRDPRRMFLDEFGEAEKKELVKFFERNKMLVVSDIIKGRGRLSADWMLVALTLDGSTKWVLKSINHALNVFGRGEVCITPRGSLAIGKITMQRKGGDGGRDTAKMLQFKVNPVELFNS